MLIVSLTHPATTCRCRWKTTIDNITIWLFLDTQGENRLYSGPKKREFLKRLIDKEYRFRDMDEARDFFTRLTALYKNFNYAPVDAPDYRKYRTQIETLAADHA